MTCDEFIELHDYHICQATTKRGVAGLIQMAWKEAEAAGIEIGRNPPAQRAQAAKVEPAKVEATDE